MYKLYNTSWADPLPARKKVNMARAYKSSSGRITQRRSGGQFRRTTLQDFGISQSELSDGNMICANCNYGEGEEKWRPVLKTGYCPKCRSQEKKSAQQNAHPTLGESATSQAVTNAETLSTSDGVPPSAPARVA